MDWLVLGKTRIYTTTKGLGPIFGVHCIVPSEAYQAAHRESPMAYQGEDFCLL